MIALIATLFPTIAGWINLIIGWFQARAAAQSAADTAEGQAETQHQTDGAQSVEDGQSVDAQDAALDQAEQAMKNPTPIQVIQPGAPNDPKP